MDVLQVAADSVVDGRYVVKREIARGGMSTVCEAHHLFSDAKVALKLLQFPGAQRPTAQARMIAEARVLGKLRHHNIVSLFDAGLCPTHGPYLAMEMIPGRPLDGLLVARRRIPVEQSVSLLMQLCAALEEVHRRGILHRDVKPGNIMISRDRHGDRVRLVDFGIARINAPGTNEGSRLTRSGELIGTVGYMAPEQLAGSDVDIRADVYSATAVFYECLTGELPYPGANALALIARQMSGTRPLALREHGLEISPAFEQVVQRGLGIEPGDRYRTVRDLARSALAALGGHEVKLELLDRTDHANAGSYISMRADETSAASAARPVGKQRQFVRAAYVTPVRLIVDNQVCDGRTADISEGGLMVVTGQQPFREGTVVTVRLPLPSSGRVAVLEATTKWVKAHRGQLAMGLEFIDLPEDTARAEIRSYVELMKSVASESG